MRRASDNQENGSEVKQLKLLFESNTDEILQSRVCGTRNLTQSRQAISSGENTLQNDVSQRSNGRFNGPSA